MKFAALLAILEIFYSAPARRADASALPSSMPRRWGSTGDHYASGSTCTTLQGYRGLRTD